MQAWEGSALVWIVDAVRSGRPSGSVHEVDARHLADLDDTGKRLGGGHLMGLGEAVELARALDRLPAELRILGIEGDDFGDGEGLSAGTTAGVARAVELLDDAAIPVDPGVRSACALMGIDPLQVANEGRLLVFVANEDAERAVAALRAAPGGESSVRIGTVVADHPGIVAARTAIGGTRIIDLPLGELLPRIC